MQHGGVALQPVRDEQRRVAVVMDDVGSQRMDRVRELAIDGQGFYGFYTISTQWYRAAMELERKVRQVEIRNGDAHRLKRLYFFLCSGRPGNADGLLVSAV